MNSIQQYILKQLYRLKHYLRLNFYFRPQSYDCIYEVTVKNISRQEKKALVVIPIPPNLQQQTIKNVVISEKGERGTEPVYKNNYFATEISIPPQSEKKITLTFSADISPISTDESSLENFNSKKTVPDNRFIITNASIEKIVKDNTKEGMSPGKKIKKLYEYVIAHVTYGNQIEGLYSTSDALTLNSVDCGGYVTLLCSLLKSIIIPCVPVFGFFANHTIGDAKKNSMHAWAYVPLKNDEVFPVDPSEDYLFRHDQAYTSGNFGWVGSDRIIFSQGCDFEIKVHDNNVRVDILQNALIIPSQDNVTIDTVFKTTRC